MKNIVIILSVFVTLVSCNQNNKNEVEQAKQMAIDSMKNQSALIEAKQKAIDSMKVVAAKQATLDSLNAANTAASAKSTSTKEQDS